MAVVTGREDPEHRDAGRGHLVIVCGLPGSGKTTLAVMLVDERNGLRLGPDDWMDALGVNLWESTMRDRVEALQWSVATEVLRLGATVIIEWGTWARSERETLRDEARALGATVELIFLDVDDAVLFNRVRERGMEDPPVTRSDIAEWRRLFEAPDQTELSAYDM